MFWFTDESNFANREAIGWKICLVDDAPEPSPWTVQLGDCSVDADGCLQSPGYPGQYSENDACYVDVNALNTKTIAVSSFSTEQSWDVLIVNERRYSGTTGPQGVVPRGTILWETDESQNDLGWKLCLIETVVSVWNVSSGACTVDADDCVQSPGFPDGYAGDESCTIEVADGNLLSISVSRRDFNSTLALYNFLGFPYDNISY